MHITQKRRLYSSFDGRKDHGHHFYLLRKLKIEFKLPYIGLILVGLTLSQMNDDREKVILV